MKTVIYIRIAAALTFVHAVLHTIGGVFGTINPGPEAVAVAAISIWDWDSALPLFSAWNL